MSRCRGRLEEHVALGPSSRPAYAPRGEATRARATTRWLWPVYLVPPLTFILGIVCATALAQSRAALSPGALSALEGRWEGTGVILGQPSRVQMEWERVLDGRFLRIRFMSHIGSEPGTQRFEGHAYYHVVAEGRYRATWFDSSGLVRPIEAIAHPDALVATWGTPDTEVGETTYRLTAPGRMDVVDRVRRSDGTWREFGRSTVTRIAEVSR